MIRLLVQPREPETDCTGTSAPYIACCVYERWCATSVFLCCRYQRQLWEQDGESITVPSVVLAEWWRGSGLQRSILEAVDVEPVSEHLGKLVGEALATLPGSTVVHAIVMASAAQRGDVVYASDFVDLERLHTHFRAVHRVLPV